MSRQKQSGSSSTNRQNIFPKYLRISLYLFKKISFKALLIAALLIFTAIIIPVTTVYRSRNGARSIGKVGKTPFKCKNPDTFLLGTQTSIPLPSTLGKSDAVLSKSSPVKMQPSAITDISASSIAKCIEEAWITYAMDWRMKTGFVKELTILKIPVLQQSQRLIEFAEDIVKKFKNFFVEKFIQFISNHRHKVLVKDEESAKRYINYMFVTYKSGFASDSLADGGSDIARPFFFVRESGLKDMEEFREKVFFPLLEPMINQATLAVLQQMPVTRVFVAELVHQGVNVTLAEEIVKKEEADIIKWLQEIFIMDYKELVFSHYPDKELSKIIYSYFTHLLSRDETLDSDTMLTAQQNAERFDKLVKDLMSQFEGNVQVPTSGFLASTTLLMGSAFIAGGLVIQCCKAKKEHKKEESKKKTEQKKLSKHIPAASSKSLVDTHQMAQKSSGEKTGVVSQNRSDAAPLGMALSSQPPCSASLPSFTTSDTPVPSVLSGNMGLFSAPKQQAVAAPEKPVVQCSETSQVLQLLDLLSQHVVLVWLWRAPGTEQCSVGVGKHWFLEVQRQIGETWRQLQGNRELVDVLRQDEYLEVFEFFSKCQRLKDKYDCFGNSQEARALEPYKNLAKIIAIENSFKNFSELLQSTRSAPSVTHEVSKYGKT